MIQLTFKDILWSSSLSQESKKSPMQCSMAYNQKNWVLGCHTLWWTQSKLNSFEKIGYLQWSCYGEKLMLRDGIVTWVSIQITPFPHRGSWPSFPKVGLKLSETFLKLPISPKNYFLTIIVSKSSSINKWSNPTLCQSNLALGPLTLA